MLEKYIFFVSKQPTLIELSDIHQVVFSRLGAGLGATAARTFDLKIVTKSGPEYTFTSINKEEHEVVSAYLQDKKVKTKNEMMEGELAIGVDDEDEEMQSVASSGEEVPKPRRGGDDDDSEEGEWTAPSASITLVLTCLLSRRRGLRGVRVGLRLADRHRLRLRGRPDCVGRERRPRLPAGS